MEAQLAQLLLNIGFFLNLIALAFREILWIRILLTCGYFLRFVTNNLQDNFNNSGSRILIEFAGTNSMCSS